MDSNDRNLGMDSNITRRDFLNGVAVTIGAGLIPEIAEGAKRRSGPIRAGTFLAQGITQDDPRYYPPLLTGMRGSHPGSFEVAHQMRDDGKWDHDRRRGYRRELRPRGCRCRHERLSRSLLFCQERRPGMPEYSSWTITTTLADTPRGMSSSTTAIRWP